MNKIEIKDAAVRVNGLIFSLSKLEFRLLPDPQATLFIPYAEADRLMAANIRCPGVGSPAVFSGIHNERRVEGHFSGQLIGVKHGMRGISFDVRLGGIEFNWGGDAIIRNGGSETPKELECGKVAVPLVADASESSAGSTAEASAEPAS